VDRAFSLRLVLGEEFCGIFVEIGGIGPGSGGINSKIGGIFPRFGGINWKFGGIRSLWSLA
jgi:hypothetical protein